VSGAAPRPLFAYPPATCSLDVVGRRFGTLAAALEVAWRMAAYGLPEGSWWVDDPIHELGEDLFGRGSFVAPRG
jgi:hypothetical protein